MYRMEILRVRSRYLDGESLPDVLVSVRGDAMANWPRRQLHEHIKAKAAKRIGQGHGVWPDPAEFVLVEYRPVDDKTPTQRKLF